MTQPFLKWAGGKRQLLANILPFIPDNFERYVEPFIGGGAVFFRLEPNNAIINDVNSELINCYRVIRDNVEELINILANHINDQEYYTEIRNLDRTEAYNNLTDIEKAARMIYLNRTCFNGLYRVNKKGQFNVPFGRYANPRILDEQLLREINMFLNDGNIDIRNGNYLDVLQECNAQDFVYLDPPYQPVNATSFTSYTSGGFDESEQIRLKEQCDILTNNGVRFMQSNSNAPLIQELYNDYNIQIVNARRNINRNANGRGAVEEVIITNY